MSSNPNSAYCASRSWCQPRSAETSTTVRTCWAVTCSDTVSNASVDSRSHATGSSKTLLRHCWWAICSASVSVGAPGEVHLQREGTGATGAAVGLCHLPQPVERLVDGHQTLTP